MSEPVPAPIKKQKHYINNPDFLRALVEYKEKKDLSTKNKTEPPPIPNYIGESS